MTILTIILGVLLIVTGVMCIFTPIATFVSTGYVVGALFLLYGIAGLVRAFRGRAFLPEIVLSILSTILGVFAFTRPGTTKVFDNVILLLVAGWFIIQGIWTMSVSLRIKGIYYRWFWGVLVGILSLLVGIFSLIYPKFGAATIGYLIGFFFIESGLHMIIFASTVDAVKKNIEDAKQAVKDIVEESYTSQDDIPPEDE